MKLNRLVQLSQIPDSEIRKCRILQQSADGITFAVSEGLPQLGFHLESEKGIDIAKGIIAGEQIGNDLADIIECSFRDLELSAIGEDAVYWAILKCYAEHRPLVLSPDMIWTVIAQYLAGHIKDNPESFRQKIVKHSGSLELTVESSQDLLTEKADWCTILDGFYDQIHENTLDGIAPAIVSDFSTSGADERISSVITLMDSVKSYFTYSVVHFICGIPSITLKGTPDDWTRLLVKSVILRRFGLSGWHNRLRPILTEFVRAAKGCPSETFWKSIVRSEDDGEFSLGGGCIPDWKEMDGWCVSLFPLIGEDGKWQYDRCMNTDHRDSEMSRVAFKYTRIYPDDSRETYPMELWSGVVGVIEDKDTFSLTPQIGWFVRRSHEKEETLNRLIEAGELGGLNLSVSKDGELPEILKELHSIERINLSFVGNVLIPDWLFDININCMQINGSVGEELMAKLRSRFSTIDYDGSCCICCK